MSQSEVKTSKGLWEQIQTDCKRHYTPPDPTDFWHEYVVGKYKEKLELQSIPQEKKDAILVLLDAKDWESVKLGMAIIEL